MGADHGFAYLQQFLFDAALVIGCGDAEKRLAESSRIFIASSHAC